MKRIASIDIFRALTMLLMLFVNDFAGMSGLPHWMHHAAFDEDMLGFSDLVFPAFLFCVGLSIPFAVGARYSKGDGVLQVIVHVVSRTLALLVMGVFSMNLGGVEGGLSRPVFTLLAVAGFFLVWNAWPRRTDGIYAPWVRVLQALGVVLLIALVIYKDLHGMPFRHSWWGILGLIGWGYLPCALAFVFLRGDFKKLVGFWVLTLLLCVLNALPAIPAEWSARAVILGFWPGGWAHPALCASGMLASLVVIHVGQGSPRKAVITLLLLGTGMFLLALVAHPVWIISKIQATPTWLFYCTAIFFPFFAFLYWLADVQGRTGWARIIGPAGTAALTCYTIPYIWNAVWRLTGLQWPAALTAGIPGLLKALAFSFLIIGLTLLFTKAHLKLKV